MGVLALLRVVVVHHQPRVPTEPALPGCHRPCGVVHVDLLESWIRGNRAGQLPSGQGNYGVAGTDVLPVTFHPAKAAEPGLRSPAPCSSTSISCARTRSGP